jgi:predicted DNA-binding transcriptional regulator YafY
VPNFAFTGGYAVSQIAVDEVNWRRSEGLAMRKEPATRLLHLARLFAADPGGITLDEIASRFVVSRRTAERLRDAIAEVFPQLEEIEGERPKRWRLPNSLSGIFREPLADELAALRPSCQD